MTWLVGWHSGVLGLSAAAATRTGLTGWQAVALGLGAVAVTGVVALFGHLLTRRSARDSQETLQKHHGDEIVEWGRQHDQWRAGFDGQYDQWRTDFERLHSRWQREQTFVLFDQAITRALSGNTSAPHVGVAQLEALMDSDIVQPEDRPLLRTVADAVLAVVAFAVDSLPPHVVVVVDDPHRRPAD